MTKREYEVCMSLGCDTLGQKIGFLGRMIHAARYSGAYAQPAEERHATVTRLRRQIKILQKRQGGN